MNDYKFQKLTPINNVDLNIYQDALDFVFTNEDIQNVGISGAYSAGKSSVINSYETLHPDKNFIHISLASFKRAMPEERKDEDKKGEKKKTSKNITGENVLEGKILNQLIHQINTDKIPQTNFRVKRPVSKFKTVLEALGFLSFICILFYIFNFSSWQYYIDGLSILWLKDLLTWTTNSACLVFGAIFMAVLLTLFAYKIIQLQKNKSIFKKVSVQGNEIEIFEQSDDSYFDKYLNEVLYLFENSNADVIIFEDMDRYDVNQIFQRLREINAIINNRRQKKQNKHYRLLKFLNIEKKPPLRFFYLLRDDIFVSKDRTKFFDFIIPIVPILDSSNSYDQFIAHFKDGELFELFDESFLQGISLYVDDMRILKNIYNEFVIYNQRIGTTEQDVNKLLALIVYKNIFPRDFSDLQLNKGFVFNLFFKKEDFIADEKQRYDNQIATLEANISAIGNEIFVSENEINALYSTRQYLDYNGQILSKYLGEREARKQEIRQRSDGSIDRFKDEIARLEQEKLLIPAKKLNEIINRENIDINFQSEYTNEIGQINHFNEIKSSEYFDLLKYLIRKGFINETYPDYMTYFYENSLSRIDKVFLRSVTDKKAKECTYTLKDPDMVVRRLSLVDFDNVETLNFDLLSHLLQTQTQTTYSKQLNQLILQLKNSNNIDFVGQFFSSGKETGRFVRHINHYWPQLFEEITQESNFSNSLKKQFALASIYFSSDEDFSGIDSEGALSNFIANCPDFLQIDAPKTARIIKIFEFLKIKFVAVEYGTANAELWVVVYSHNLYEINIGMLNTILESQYHIPPSNDYNHENFSLILSRPDEPLVAYVQNNMDQYMGVMLSNCDSSISDNEDAITYILNDETINNENKTTYIEYLQSPITSLNGIKDSKWWAPIIQHNRLIYSIENVLCYFFGVNKELDDVLVQFINNFGKKFGFKYDAIDEEFGENSGSAFLDAVIQCNSLNNDKYSAILKSLSGYYESFEIEGIDEDKIDILIDISAIHMSSDTLIFMRENYQDNLFHFIEANIQTYTDEVLSESNFLLDEALELLKSDIEDTHKIQLLKFTDEPISVVNQKNSAEVESYILEHNFDTNDLPYLLQHYNDLYEPSKEITDKLAIRYINNITSNKYVLAQTLLLNLLSSQSLDSSDKLKLFSQALHSLGETQCKRCLEILGLNDFLSLFDGKRPTFEINDVHNDILSTFKNNGWITKFEEENGSGCYRAFGRKRHYKR